MASANREETKITWEKVPSVYSGGKPFFYVGFSEGIKYSVVWDRYFKKWSACLEDLQVDLCAHEIGYFQTAKEGIDFLNSL